MEQNYKNHSRFNPAYHFVAIPFTFIVFCYSVYLFVLHSDTTHGLIAIGFALLLVTLFFARYFSLRVQDRAARAEERLRYFMLTGKSLPSQLRMRQILALRFASDEEFVALTEKAVIEKLSAKEIKLLIKNWRADHYRI
jgi:hypothetical protein